MPVRNLNEYTCPVTHKVQYATELPPFWFEIEGECFAPEARVPLAQHIIDNPTVDFKELIAFLNTQQA